MIFFAALGVISFIFGVLPQFIYGTDKDKEWVIMYSMTWTLVFVGSLACLLWMDVRVCISNFPEHPCN